VCAKARMLLFFVRHPRRHVADLGKAPVAMYIGKVESHAFTQDHQSATREIFQGNHNLK